MTEIKIPLRSALLTAAFVPLAACGQPAERSTSETVTNTTVTTSSDTTFDPAVGPTPAASPVATTNNATETTAPVASSAPSSDGTETIRFPSGGTAVTLAGMLAGPSDKRYRFEARAGQPARIALSDPADALAFNLYAPGSGPGGEALFRGSRAGRRYLATLPQDGSYTIQVYRMNAAAGPDRATYRLSVAVEQPGADAATPGLSGSPADDPAGVIRTYYRAIDRGDYARAYTEWEDDGRASGKSLAQFRDGFTQTRSTAVQIGRPGRSEGAAGSVYLTIPVDVRATLRDGRTQHFGGSYVLRRVNDVDGSSAEDRRWHLHSASLKPLG